LNILFWNTSRNDDKNNINDSIKEMTLEKSCDIVVLAEYSFDINELISLINVSGKKSFIMIPDNLGCKKIKGFISNTYNTEVLQEQTRYKIIKLETTYYKLIIGMIHNVDKFSSSENEQKEILRLFSNDIFEVETRHNTKNTIVLGDFNASPFEESLIAANAMHAIPYRNETTDKGRRVNGVYYEKFYNPMWKLLAKEESPYATFHYNNSKLANYYWYMLDQFIIRPGLIPAFDESTLNILTETKGHKLIKENGFPNKDDYSDHLPIFCTIKEEKLR